MSTFDRITRLILVVVILSLSYARVINGVFAVILSVIGIIFAVTAFVGTCPIYSLLGFNSRTAKKG